MWVLVPTDEILFFARTKKSIQKKSARRRLLPALLAFTEGCQKGLPCPFDNVRLPCRTPNGLFPVNAPMLGAAYGRWRVFVGWGKLVNPNKYIGRCHVGVRTSPQPTVLPHPLRAIPDKCSDARRGIREMGDYLM
jgi:hypothetical protein